MLSRLWQVIWVDLLTTAEFEAGFGSHTPMFSGQTKCVRYYMNFERALRLMKEVIAQEGHTFDANNKPGQLPPTASRPSPPPSRVCITCLLSCCCCSEQTLTRSLALVAIKIQHDAVTQ